MTRMIYKVAARAIKLDKHYGQCKIETYYFEQWSTIN